MAVKKSKEKVFSRDYVYNLSSGYKVEHVDAPLGYNGKVSACELEALLHTDTAGRKVQIAEMRARQAQAIAMAPGKQLFMTAFMLWMSGFQISIWSMMFTGMAMMNPVRSILSVNAAFKPLEGNNVSFIQYKLMFLALNCVGLAMAAYKCHYMGLLPLHSSDWVGLLPSRVSTEWSGGGNVL